MIEPNLKSSEQMQLCKPKKVKKRLVIVESVEKNNTNTNTNTNTNRGTGAGGSNTNMNGLPYESLTDLDDKINTLKTDKYSKIIQFIGFENKLIKTRQSNLFKCLDDCVNKSIEKAHGCKNPDECFIEPNNKILFIIEKKFQNVGGSVCEKIQTSDFKIWQYGRSFPSYKIVYIYCLSDWFKENCKAELEYLNFKNVPVFWGNSIEYKNDIINFIINYK